MARQLSVRRVRVVFAFVTVFFYAGVAQLAVHAICNREVDGSIPFAGSIWAVGRVRLIALVLKTRGG